MATTYPFTQNSVLPYGVVTTTVITNVAGTQAATTSYTGCAGPLGQIILTPENPNAADVMFRQGLQTVLIQSATFMPASGFDVGEVINVGVNTDESGNNPIQFSEEICTWTE